MRRGTPPKELKRGGVSVAEGLRRLSRKGLHERVVAVRQIHDQGHAPCVRRRSMTTSASPKSTWASPGGCVSGTNISCRPSVCSRTEALTIVSAAREGVLRA